MSKVSINVTGKIDSIRLVILTFLLISPVTLSAGSQENSGQSEASKPAKIYSSPEERRDAGLGRKLTEWLTVSGLAEVETEFKEDDFRGAIPSRDKNETTQSVQLGFDVTFSELINAEFVFEYEMDKGHAALDEGVINLETESWGLSAGRLYVPFGEYYSHFVTGPMLEFGETRADALTLDYSHEGFIELFAFVLISDARSAGNDDTFDGGFGIEFSSQDEALKIGASYLSDLAETDELFLEDYNNVYQERVAGWSAYAFAGLDTFEITAEIVKAIHSFAEFERNANKPWAANMEFAWFPRPSIQIAARIEASGELMDQPERQYGVSATWRIGKTITLAADYLFGEFKDGFVFDDDENELDTSNQFAAQISIEF